LLYRERNTWIQNSQRRELDVVLDRNNEILLSQVRLVNPTSLANLGTVSYQYDADELLTRASSGTTRLDLRYHSDVALPLSVNIAS
jgi:hypothetical protein